MDPLKQTIVNAKRGEELALEELIGLFGSVIRWECRQYNLRLNPDWSHADLFQEVMLQILVKLDQFQGIDANDLRAVFEAWIRRVARSVLADLHRHRTARKRSPDKPAVPLNEFDQSQASRRPPKSASSVFAYFENEALLKTSMNDCLDEIDRQIIDLRIAEGLSWKEISSRLSMTYDQVRYKFETSLSKLQETFDRT